MKTAVVTGVSSGIGRATAELLARNGFRTFGTVRNDTVPITNVELLRLDVRDPEAVRSSVATVLDRAGRIDVLVNSAAVMLLGAVEETDLDEARNLFETNFFGVLSFTGAVLPAMRAQGCGRIINIGSVLGFLAVPFMSIYVASKHALEGFSDSLDQEVRAFGIRIVVVQPSFTRTQIAHNSPSTRQSLPNYLDDRERVSANLATRIDRGVDPASVAKVVHRAVAARFPHRRYRVGSEAKLFRVAQSLLPSSVIDWGVRKTFGIETVPVRR
jgi:NAD(P)-dependent dehydrogenase (short-subunit alcohol dehydrogenase family)